MKVLSPQSMNRFMYTLVLYFGIYMLYVLWHGNASRYTFEGSNGWHIGNHLKDIDCTFQRSLFFLSHYIFVTVVKICCEHNLCNLNEFILFWWWLIMCSRPLLVLQWDGGAMYIIPHYISIQFILWLGVSTDAMLKETYVIECIVKLLLHSMMSEENTSR